MMDNKPDFLENMKDIFQSELAPNEMKNDDIEMVKHLLNKYQQKRSHLKPEKPRIKTSIKNHIDKNQSKNDNTPKDTIHQLNHSIQWLNQELSQREQVINQLEKKLLLQRKNHKTISMLQNDILDLTKRLLQSNATNSEYIKKMRYLEQKLVLLENLLKEEKIKSAKSDQSGKTINIKGDFADFLFSKNEERNYSLMIKRLKYLLKLVHPNNTFNSKNEKLKHFSGLFTRNVNRYRDQLEENQ